MWQITKFRTNYVGEVGFEIKIRARENLNFFLSFQTIFENNSNYIEFI
jgi:glycine cleavage system aminomethyltransferase T